MENPTKLRQRDMAHLWADKRVLRFFRHTFNKKDYKNLRNVYLALCEIDSDFTEERNSDTKSIHNLTKTCATYAGMDQGNVSEVLQFLRQIYLIDYGIKKDKANRFIGSYLQMYIFDEKTHTRKNPSMETSGPIKNINRYYKELLKKISKVKNLSSKEERGTDVPTTPTQNKEHLIRRSQPTPIKEDKKDSGSPLDGLSPFVRDKIVYWNSMESLQHLSLRTPPTKAFMKAVNALSKVENNDSMRIELTEAIERYNELLSYPLSKPTRAVPGYRVGFDEFFKFSSMTLERMRKQKVDFPYKSWYAAMCNGGFEEMMEEQLPEEDDPVLTKKLMKLYVERVLGGIKKKFSFEERRKFILGSNRLRTFYLEKRKDFVVDEGLSVFAEDLFKALEMQFKDGFKVGNLCSGYTYTDCLPEYMNRQAMLMN